MSATRTEGLFRLAPVVFLLLWSAGFGVAKVGLAYAPPLTFLSARYALVLAALLPLVAVVRPPWPGTRAGWLHLVVVGALVQLGYFAMSWSAIARGSGVGVAALITSLQPVLVALVSPILGGPRLGGRVWTGLALGLLGAAIVIAARSGVDAPTAIGLVLAVGSTLSMTAGTLYEKRFGSAAHPLASAVVQYAVGLAGALTLACAIEDVRIEWTPRFIGAVAYLVLANSLVAITLLLAMVRRGEVARVSALLFLVPPIAALMAWGLTGEPLPPAAWVGMGVAACGVALATHRSGDAK